MLLLLATAALYFVLGEARDAATLSSFVVIVVTITLVQERRTEKSGVARDDALRKIFGIYEIRYKKRVFKCGKTERGGYHVNHRIDRLVHVFTFQPSPISGKIFEYFFYGRPKEYGEKRYFAD